MIRYWFKNSFEKMTMKLTSLNGGTEHMNMYHLPIHSSIGTKDELWAYFFYWWWRKNSKNLCKMTTCHRLCDFTIMPSILSSFCHSCPIKWGMRVTSSPSAPFLSRLHVSHMPEKSARERAGTRQTHAVVHRHVHIMHTSVRLARENWHILDVKRSWLAKR